MGGGVELCGDDHRFADGDSGVHVRTAAQSAERRRGDLSTAVRRIHRVFETGAGESGFAVTAPRIEGHHTYRGTKRTEIRAIQYPDFLVRTRLSVGLRRSHGSPDAAFVEILGG